MFFLIILSSCKKNRDNSSRTVSKNSKIKKERGINLTKAHHLSSRNTYSKDLEFKIDSVYLKEIKPEKYEIRAYLKGDFLKYSGYNCYLRLYAMDNELELIPQERRKYKYVSLHFPFEVFQDSLNDKYIKKIFETELSRLVQIAFIVTEPKQQDIILDYAIDDIRFFEMF